ncbi:MAG: phosphatidylserine/phosphatidylglycerophosphate/cardiolipin synthase family protein [Novosphingobium sp.]
MPGIELHIGSAAFWQRAAEDIAAARCRVLVQAMTFEGDRAGLGVAAAIAGSGADDRRVLVDDYTRRVINDTFLKASADPAIHAEAAATWAMFDRLRGSGAGVRITNPMGRNWLRYPLRNHKKLIVADNAAWIGGINFSDHNFAWHDMMLRIEDPAVADWLAETFAADWAGTPRPQHRQFSAELELLSLDGIENATQFAPLLQLFGEARRSIEVISAYPTFPFVEAFAAAASRGVATTIFTPRPSNKPIVRDYLLARTARSEIAVRLLPDMTHVKAALVDGETLVVGSSNFDFVSFRTSADHVALIRDPTVIEQAVARLFAPARAASSPPMPADAPHWRGLASTLVLRSADAIIARLRHRDHVEEWSAPSATTRLAEPGPAR